MGMYDTVHITCPNCRKVTELQSKAGASMLEEYPLELAPPEIVADLIKYENPIKCVSCGYSMRIRMHTDVYVV